MQTYNSNSRQEGLRLPSFGELSAATGRPIERPTSPLDNGLGYGPGSAFPTPDGTQPRARYVFPPAAGPPSAGPPVFAGFQQPHVQQQPQQRHRHHQPVPPPKQQQQQQQQQQPPPSSTVMAPPLPIPPQNDTNGGPRSGLDPPQLPPYRTQTQPAVFVKEPNQPPPAMLSFHRSSHSEPLIALADASEMMSQRNDSDPPIAQQHNQDVGLLYDIRAGALEIDQLNQKIQRIAQDLQGLLENGSVTPKVIDEFLLRPDYEDLTKMAFQLGFMSSTLHRWIQAHEFLKHNVERQASAVNSNNPNNSHASNNSGSNNNITVISPTSKQSMNNLRKESISLKVSPQTPVTKAQDTLDLDNRGSRANISTNIPPRCLQCGSGDTPEWRRGPYGARTLCNACGLFHAKLTKKKGAPEAARIMQSRRRLGLGSERRISLLSGSEIEQDR
ncbi:hypothetical protein LJB42_001021 [Komagataella kurtzmanii]|nr:hypothetical protein LJB42_001021 [Komagataella kurtzmanii]